MTLVRLSDILQAGSAVERCSYFSGCKVPGHNAKKPIRSIVPIRGFAKLEGFTRHYF